MVDGTDEKYESDEEYFSSIPVSVDVDEMAKKLTSGHTSIDHLELPARAYNCPKRVNVHTISDLLNYSQDDSKRIKNFGSKSVEQVVEALKEHFAIQLPRDKFSIE